MGRKNSSNPVITLIVVAILAFGAWYVYNHYFKPLDVEKDLRMTEQQLSAKYHSTFADNPGMANKVPQYSEAEKNTITVRSDGNFDVIYADGVQIGVGTANKRATAYDIKWGDGDETAMQKVNFSDEVPFEVLNDMAEGHSIATFFPNKEKNTCFVYVRNNTTGRVIYLAYYNDLKKITGALSY